MNVIDCKLFYFNMTQLYSYSKMKIFQQDEVDIFRKLTPFQIVNSAKITWYETIKGMEAKQAIGYMEINMFLNDQDMLKY
ncbi:unnamed protein product [Paramecium octaurelia]|uniref:Uncharacterized protein n=1 Tax=Paramecium octaurelia TaxID=43137 RepID=A0A8S1Y2A1_PAROT|nr:unnamed protein product [Paramecium octaurelia]